MQLKNIIRELAVPIATIVSVLVSGTIIFHKLEGWRYLDAFYYTAIVVTTVGLGDFVPRTDVSKILTALFAMTGIGIVVYSLTRIGSIYFHLQERVLPQFNKRKR